MYLIRSPLGGDGGIVSDNATSRSESGALWCSISGELSSQKTSNAVNGIIASPNARGTLAAWFRRRTLAQPRRTQPAGGRGSRGASVTVRIQGDHGSVAYRTIKIKHINLK